jgi:hypothetical protein
VLLELMEPMVLRFALPFDVIIFRHAVSFILAFCNFSRATFDMCFTWCRVSRGIPVHLVHLERLA